MAVFLPRESWQSGVGNYIYPGVAWEANMALERHQGYFSGQH